MLPDHLLVVSDRVKEGFHGDQPSLTDLGQGDLKASQDFRSLYAELLTSVRPHPRGRIGHHRVAGPPMNT